MTKHLAGFPLLIKPLAALLSALLLTVLSPPEGTAASAYAEAVGLMKREQTLGEAGAGLLKTFAKDDIPTLAQGIQHYALAQADFNGLLETLQATLIEGGRACRLKALPGGPGPGGQKACRVDRLCGREGALPQPARRKVSCGRTG